MAKVSMTDVAKALNVSKTLVSMVLNGKGDEYGINAETQQRVLDKMKELNYKPNQIARGLRTGKSHLLGLIVSDISNPFYAKIARSIEDKVAKVGYNLIIASSDENPDRESNLIQVMRDRQADGIILSTTQTSLEDIKQMKQDEYPFVLIDRKVGKVQTNHVVVDNYAGGYQATKHLIESGYSRIGLITISPAHLSTMKERESGYKQALRDNGIRVDKNLIAEVPFENIEKGVEEIIRNFFTSEKSVQAVFVANNHIATACLAAAETLRFRIPMDLAIVSFDDVELFKYCHPPVTCIAQPVASIGEKAVDVLMGVIEGDAELQQITLEPELVLRKSCGGYLTA